LTLPELLVAMTLTGVLLSLVYPIFSGTVKTMLRADADTQSQQKAVLLVEKFFADFASTSRSSLAIVDTIPAASFLSQRPMGVAGLPMLRSSDDYYPSTANSAPVVWHKFVAMRFNAEDKTLEKLEFPYPDGSQLGCMQPDQLAALLGDFRYRDSRRTVVHGIESMSLHAIGDSSISLELTSLQRFDVDRTTQIQVTLTMRN
jgi:type II secretory pathway pseudopilin PulG